MRPIAKVAESPIAEEIASDRTYHRRWLSFSSSRCFGRAHHHINDPLQALDAQGMPTF